MSTTKKVSTLLGVALMAMATLFGCSLLLRDGSEQSDWHIKLNINYPAVAKAITFTEYDVTGLVIEVYDPEDQLIDTVAWEADEGAMSYLIPVSEQGQHQIVVTHIGEKNGEIVEAEESALFNIQAMVITVIDIIPGCIGTINVEPGDEEPQTPIDLTGYWDWFYTLFGEEFGPEEFYIHQTDSTLDCDMGFSGSISGSTVELEAWIDTGEEGGPFYVLFIGTVSGDEISGYEISGPVTGELGEGSFRFVYPSTIPFGHLELQGTVEGVKISLDTEYATATGGDTETRYMHRFPLNMGLFTGYIRFETNEPSTGTFMVTPDEPHEADQIHVSLWDGTMEHNASGGFVEITRYEGTGSMAGMAGTFDLSFNGSNLTGTFDLFFDSPSGWTSTEGMWQGNPVPYTESFSVFSEKEVWTTGHFELNHSDHELEVTLFMHVEGGLAERTYVAPADQWWIDMIWLRDGQGLYEIVINDTGTLNITRFVENDGIAGTFDALGGALIGSFDVSFVEANEPD